ncbi:MAG: hypothetical protein NTX50_13730 [Candidatus Sumerlaeota bacterium]|nr:hypothetical protein [Candidatus Sumerlaeota bacterium]
MKPTTHAVRIAEIALIAVAALFAAAPVWLRAAEEPPLKPAELAAIGKSLSSSFVRVEYHLQTDRGESPQAATENDWPSYYRRYYAANLDEHVKQERPLEIGGYALSPTRVAISDPQIHPRFIKEIRARFGSESAIAKPAIYILDQDAIILELDKPLAGVKPLEFKADAPRPYVLAVYGRQEGEWKVTMQPGGGYVVVRDKGQPFVKLSGFGLIANREGTPVGLALDGELPADDSWKGGPDKWRTSPAADIAKTLERIEKIAGAGLPRVELVFRSPKGDKEGGMMSRMRYRSGDEDEDSGKGMDHNVIGALLSKTTVLVLANMKPKVTARLEKILVHTPDGKTVPARFEATLKDDGCFVATLEKPVEGALQAVQGDIVELRNKPLIVARVSIEGETRVAYFQPARFTSFSEGMKNRVFPQYSGDVKHLFFFDAEGRIAALPIAPREKPSAGQREYMRDGPELTPVTYLTAAVEKLAENRDVANAPLSETEENRLAWLGIEMQGIDEDLARANDVSKQTRNGQIGVMVTYVYPNSPAAKAGIEVGNVLLRLRVDGRPNPIDIQAQDESEFTRAFPWERLGELQDIYFDRLPSPWPPAENFLTRLLTELGAGTKYKAELITGGKSITKDFAVELSPPHYESAPKQKNEALGLTVRDLTYEVRRYLKKGADEPGVVISKIEPGSKTAVAGVKPYELITHINEKPVTSAEEFKKLTSEPGELKFSVKRMTKGRIVTIRLTEDDIKKAAEKKTEDKKPDGQKPDEKKADIK